MLVDGLLLCFEQEIIVKEGGIAALVLLFEAGTDVAKERAAGAIRNLVASTPSRVRNLKYIVRLRLYLPYMLSPKT